MKNPAGSEEIYQCDLVSRSYIFKPLFCKGSLSDIDKTEKVYHYSYTTEVNYEKKEKLSKVADNSGMVSCRWNSDQKLVATGFL